ncbi:unnamed protein product [Arctogadus glacialis]
MQVKRLIWLCLLDIAILLKSCAALFNTTNSKSTSNTTGWFVDYGSIDTKFSLRTAEEPEEDMCYIRPGRQESIAECGFNITAQTFAIVHGWTVAGIFEGWVSQLVSALLEREPSANVIVVDWLKRAQHHYPNAAQHTQLAGQDLAALINWLELDVKYDLSKLHLLGFSLGAHVAGVAGNLAYSKVNRITGMDPAGPHFEYADELRRLSPDDASFVDVVHTNTKGSPDLSIGIQRPVGHVDIYPNGGMDQPGCSLQHTLQMMATFGLQKVGLIMGCAHERSVHLFIDSLVNRERQSVAYRCSSKDAFDRGQCLSCRRNRCNTLGYGAHLQHTPRAAKMYLKTTDRTPFKVFHYQIKVHLCSWKSLTFSQQPLLVSLHGTLGDKENIFVILEELSANHTASFLVTSDVEVGELLRVNLQWESDSVFSFFNTNQFTVHRMRVKAGETQAKIKFTARGADLAQLVQGGEAAVFFRTKENQTNRRHKRLHLPKGQLP